MEKVAAFMDVGLASQFPQGSRKVIQVGTQPVLILHTASGFIAFDDYCPHRAGPLSEGELRGSTITCPWHGARFDINTGEARDGSARHLRMRTVRVVDGKLEVSQVIQS